MPQYRPFAAGRKRQSDDEGDEEAVVGFGHSRASLEERAAVAMRDHSLEEDLFAAEAQHMQVSLR